MTDFVKMLLEKAVMEIANQTDAAWQNELTRVFGQRASTARYLPEGKGAPGSALRDLYENHISAIKLLEKEIWK
jgi:hypothetical protein